MRQWWANNWDKVTSVLVSVVVAGTIGYFSGVLAVQADITAVRERVSVLEADSKTAKDDLKRINGMTENHTTTITRADGRLDLLEKQNEIAVQSSKLIDLRMEQQRTETLNALRRLFEEP